MLMSSEAIQDFMNHIRQWRLEYTVQFFEDKQNHETLNRLTQLLGRQRKQEDFLRSERTYAPRVEGVPTVMVEALKREQDKGRRK